MLFFYFILAVKSHQAYQAQAIGTEKITEKSGSTE